MNESRQKEVGGSRLWSVARASALGLFAMTLAACGDSTGPVDLRAVSVMAPEEVHFTVQSAGGYRQIVVPVKITNSTSKVINRAYCSETLERFEGAGWNAVWSPFCIAIFSNDPIAPGETKTVSLTIGDTPAQYSGFRFTDPEHQYRIRVEIYVGGDDGTAALSTRAASNVFQVLP